jgi:hypothetical protein
MSPSYRGLRRRCQHLLGHSDPYIHRSNRKKLLAGVGGKGRYVRDGNLAASRVVLNRVWRDPPSLLLL